MLSHSGEWSLVEPSWWWLLIPVILFLGLYSLETFPRIWFDEGDILQAPKNLVLYGQYGIKSSEGFRAFTPETTTGPTLLLPVALVFRLFGIGLVQARLVAIFFAFTAVGLFFQVARLLYSRRIAVVATLLLVANPNVWANPLLTGRYVMGEVTAWGFFLAGTIIWLRSSKVSGRKLPAMLAGLCIGFAMLTKGQYLPLVMALFLCLGIIDLLRRRRSFIRGFLFPLAVSLVPLMIWYGVQLFFIGWNSFVEHVVLLRSASSTTLTAFSMKYMLRNLANLFSVDFFKLGCVGFLYVVSLLLRGETRDTQRLYLPAFVGLWMIWFVVASVGFTRYAFPIFATSNLFLAKLLHDLSKGFSLSFPQFGRHTVLSFFKRTLPVLATLGTVMLVLVPLGVTVQRVTAGRDRTPQQFAAYIDENIDSDATIETWEYEIAFLTAPHRYHHPPLDVLLAVIAHINLDAPFTPDIYPFEQVDPDYLIIGSFAKWTKLYSLDFLEQECTLIKSIGAYDLYRVNVSERR